MQKIYLLLTTAATLFLGYPLSAQTVQLQKVGSYTTGIYDAGATEIAAFDPFTDQLFSVNGSTGDIDVIDISDVTSPTLAFTIDLTPYGGGANSVAVKNGIVAAAVEDTIKTNPGKVVFFDTDGNYINSVVVGAQPDMIIFTPNGKRVLTANEGEPNDDYTIDPAGSVSIINISGGVAAVTAAQVMTVDFAAYDTLPLPAEVRVFGPGAMPSTNIEPEYITISKNNKFAYVTLQEANAIAEINVQTGAMEIWPLGYKDHLLAENAFDATDKNGGIVQIANWPVYGMYQPDAIEYFSAPTGNYLVMANEGDVRDWDGYSEIDRINSLVLDSVIFPDSLDLQNDNLLGRLNVTNTMGDIDADGDFDALYAFGGRSITIRSLDGSIVWDSGADIELRTLDLHPANFNASNTSNSKKGRSDDKGPEPEGLTTAKILDSIYVFVGLERIGDIMVYNITNPSAAYYVTSTSSRNFAETPGAGLGGDLGPEGLLFIPAAQSPNGRNLLVVSYEISGSIGIYTTDITCGTGKVLVCYGGVTYCAKPTTAAALIAAGGTYGSCRNAENPQEIADAHIQIFPNPSTDYIHVVMEDVTDNEVLVTIADMTGNKVYQELHSVNTDRSLSGSIDIRQFAQGTYFVLCSSKNTTATQTFVKQ